MPFSVESHEQERFAIRLVDEPPFVHSLMMAPTTRETALNEGHWLVLSFAVWSMTDIEAVSLAIEFARSLDGHLNLGLRPFESADEFDSWCEVEIVDASSLIEVSAETTTNDGFQPSITGEAGSTPIWLCLRDGVVVRGHFGLLNLKGLQSL